MPAPTALHADAPYCKAIFAGVRVVLATSSGRPGLLADYDEKTHTIRVSLLGQAQASVSKQITFNHEFRHHEERLKIEAGDFSLRRISLQTKARADRNEPLSDYNERLSFDELETYFADLKAHRASGLETKPLSEFVKRLIATARRTLTELEQKIENRAVSGDEMLQLMQSPWGTGLAPNPPPMNHSLSFQLSDGEVLAINVSLKSSYPNRPKRSELSQALSDTIYEAQVRVDEIEHELKALKF